jgi:hypothetical protein
MADDEQFSMTEQLSFMDMLQPWPHRLHIQTDQTTAFACCDCGWVGEVVPAQRTAALQYRDHIERMD